MGKKFKVIIVGAGSAGLSALDEVVKQTDDYLLIDNGPLGTSCARVACMPTKTLIEAADAYHARHRFAARGIHGAEALRVSIPEVLNYVRRLRDYFSKGLVDYVKGLGENYLAGRARFVSPQEIEVNGLTYFGERIIIATGSRPIIPEAWQPLRKYLLTTDEFFEQPDLPPAMAAIGLGPAGLELAQAMSRLGVTVYGIDAAKIIGGLSDQQVSDAAVRALSKEFTIFLGEEPSLAAEAERDVLAIACQGKNLRVDKALVAIGRRPNVDDLGLAALGLQTDQRGIPLFNADSMQIGDWPVFIAGDAGGYRPILHEAVDEGLIAGFNAVRRQHHCFQRRTPLSITFSKPNLAVAGRAFRELAGEDLVIGAFDFEKQSRALMSDRNTGLLRVYVARREGRLLGAEMAAPDGEHLAHLLAWCIQQKLNVYQILRLPFYHPVVEEGLRTALGRAARQLEGEFGIEHLLCGSAPPQCIC